MGLNLVITGSTLLAPCYTCQEGERAPLSVLPVSVPAFVLAVCGLRFPMLSFNPGERHILRRERLASFENKTLTTHPPPPRRVCEAGVVALAPGPI
jgi:hypothetical protein